MAVDVRRREDESRGLVQTQGWGSQSPATPRIYLANAFALSMLGDAQNARLVVTKIPLDVAKQLLAGGNFVSAIGHAATADLLTRLLGVQVPMNRVAIKLNPGDAVLVFQLRGRLPEGAVIQNPEELEKIGYDFWLVQLE